ncbi:MAG: hypothetical protein DHS20C02_07730 [Micavibrio sp.]|nr:MAG: hypothetical protein DHS20C02_07730 [Micavibrio sp.]
MGKRKRTDFFSASWGWFFVLLGVVFAIPFAIKALVIHDYFTYERLSAPFFENQLYNNILLWLHIVLAIPPMALGPALLHEQFRNNHLWLHRQMGKIYVIGAMSSSVVGVMLALANTALFAKFGFGLLGTLWFTTTFIAYKKIRARDFISHRRWMIRSFAFAFAFLTVRFWAVSLVMIFPDLDMKIHMAMRSWFAWVPNIIVAQIYIMTTSHRGQFLGWDKLRDVFLPESKKETSDKGPPH